MSRKFIVIHVVVGILIDEEGKFLVGLRPDDKPYAGYWEFPGGKVEANESPRVALERELQEELAIEVVKAESWFQHTHQYPDKKVWLDVWKITEFRGQPHGMEGQRLAWVTVQELQELRVLEGNYELVQFLMNSS